MVLKSMNALLIEELMGMTPSWTETIFTAALPTIL